LAGSFSNRIFIHDYPNNPKIEAHYESNGRLYYSYYNIISLGSYPIVPKLTQKNGWNNTPYPIPDNYVVETELAERSLRCEIYLKFKSTLYNYLEGGACRVERK